MKSILIGVAFLLIIAASALGVTVDGFCYLDHQWSHAGTQVKFLKVSPSAVTDSAYSDASGHFAKSIVAGIYHVIYSHTLYESDTLLSQVFTANTTLPSDTLFRPLAGIMSGNLGPGYFRVRNNLTVQSNTTLTIHPATILCFDGPFALSVYGTLRAIGSESDSIVFTKQPTTVGWLGVQILGGNNSRLDYCTIEQTDSPDSAWGLTLQNSSPSIEHSTIRHCLGGYFDGFGHHYGYGSAIKLVQSMPVFDSCNIDSNGSYYSNISAVRSYNNSRPSFTECNFRGNVGDAIRATGEGQLSVSRCTFLYNSGSGAVCEQSTLIAINCFFEGNGCGILAYGPCSVRSCTMSRNNCGISCWQTIGMIDSCDFTENTGIGISCSGSGTVPVFSNCRIIRNSSTGWSNGAGVYCSEYASPRFTNCSIDSNEAGQFGGGVYCTNYARPEFGNCTFLRNSAGVNGGGGYTENQAIPSFVNCTFFGNFTEQPNNTGGIYIRGGAPLFNSSVIANSSGYGLTFDADAGNSQIQYCNIYPKCITAMWSYSMPPAIGQYLVTNANGDSADIYMNIFEDPMFVDTLAGNVNLQVHSPCVDAGDPSLPRDADGTLADIGARCFVQDLTVSARSVTFGDVAVGAFGLQTLTLFNRTSSAITIHSMTCDNPVFSLTNNPVDSILAPGASLVFSVRFIPTAISTASGHLIVSSDAIYNSSISVALSGMGGLVPAPVRDVVLQVMGSDAQISWSGVDSTVYGNPLVVDAYLVYFAERVEGPYWFLGLSTDTTYVHPHVAQFAHSMYYEVTSYVGSVSKLNDTIQRLGGQPTAEQLHRAIEPSQN